MAAAGCRLTVVAVDAQCHQMVAAAGTRCLRMVVAAEASAEAARLRMAVAAEVTHPPMEGVAVVGILPAAEVAGMPRLRAAVEATTVGAGPTAATAVGTGTTKFFKFVPARDTPLNKNWAAFSFRVDPTKSCGSETCLRQRDGAP